jgi:predicted HTH domain antitoxin
MEILVTYSTVKDSNSLEKCKYCNRYLLYDGVYMSKTLSLENALELYKKGQVTGSKAAKLAGISLWNFYKALNEKGVLIQYSEQDLEAA